jgi:hypothetical protein
MPTWAAAVTASAALLIPNGCEFCMLPCVWPFWAAPCDCGCFACAALATLSASAAAAAAAAATAAADYRTLQQVRARCTHSKLFIQQQTPRAL